jgi:hypothetical protein
VNFQPPKIIKLIFMVGFAMLKIIRAVFVVGLDLHKNHQAKY